MKSYFYISVLLAVVFSFNLDAQNTKYPKHEMRGVWIATLVNIDWPSKNSTIRQQKDEYLNLLDSLQKVNINAVLFQVRPHGDAFYKSSYEPWSEYLMGKQGVAPSDKTGSYDPLQFITEEAHKRGMEVHAWVNPYRITAYSDSSRLDSSHIYFKHPEWFVKHTADGRFYFIPGIPESQEFVLNVIEEMIANYDVDALHFDDYFYQYPDKYGNNINDNLQYNQYVAQFNSKTSTKLDTIVTTVNGVDSLQVVEIKREFDNIHDWRRNNVNMMVKAVHNKVKQTKPWVKFGISPFGVYKNKNEQNPDGSDTQAGATNYYDLYADVLYWMEQGWVDYVTPQIYWRTDHTKAAFDVLLDWWDNHYNEKVKLFIGQGIYRVGHPAFQKYDFWTKTDGFVNQIDLIRASKHAEGSMFFSAKYFITNPLGINEVLREGQYKYPAIAPVYAYAEANNSVVGKIKVSGSRNEGVKLQWDDILDNDIRYYLVYRFEGEEIGDIENAENIIAKVSGYKLRQEFTDTTVRMWKKYTYVITSVDRFNVESKASKAITLKGKRSSVKIYN
jgi:uncharacterized lipoprotein YddW (UPF0748 family)